jgi:hypothetical protein
MRNYVPDNRIDGVIISGIEDAVDSANLLSLDLAIDAFDSEEDFLNSHSGNGKVFKYAAERGLHATGTIERMMTDLRICANLQ